MKWLLASIVIVLSLSLVGSSYAVQYTGQKATISIGFDHGFKSQYQGALYMKTKNMTGTIYVVTNRTANTSFLPWASLHTLYDMGWEMSSHTRNHVKINDLLSSDKLYQEVVGSKYDLIQQGFSVCGFVPPSDTLNPYTNPTSFQMIAKNYNYTMKGFNSLNTVKTLTNYKNNFKITIITAYQVGDLQPASYVSNFTIAKNLIDNAIATNGSLDFHFHDLINNTTTQGKQYPTSIALFTGIIDYIKSKVDSNQLLVLNQSQIIGC